RRNELTGNSTTYYSVNKFKLSVRCARFETYLTVTVLTCTARLFLVLAFRFNALLDCFSVSNTWFFQHCFATELVLQLTAQDFKLCFAYTRQQHFVCFGIFYNGKGNVFILQLVESGKNLVFLTLLGSVNSHGKHGTWHLDFRQTHGFAFAQCI